MTSYQDVRSSDESTSLLSVLPSSHSTGIPTVKSQELIMRSLSRELVSSYQNNAGNTSNGGEVELQASPGWNYKSNQSYTNQANTCQQKLMKRHRATIWTFAAALFLVVLAFPFVKNHVGNGGSPGGGGGKNKHHAPFNNPKPFSTLDPVQDVGLHKYSRSKDSSPAVFGNGAEKSAAPTNAWYQNLLLLPSSAEPSTVQRAYAVPYVLDLTGPVPGLRVDPNHIDVSQTVVQLSYLEQHGLTLGAAPNAAESASANGAFSKRYSVLSHTPLGLTLKWESYPMVSSIVRGMPYATMEYHATSFTDDGGRVMFPTIASEMALRKDSDAIADGNTIVPCGPQASKVRVHRELELSFDQSDFTWLVFFSRAVWVRCIAPSSSHQQGPVSIQVVENEQQDASINNDQPSLVVRAAILTTCTTGANPLFCNKQQSFSTAVLQGDDDYAKLLRERAHLYPGQNTAVEYSIEDDQDTATLFLHWDVQDMKTVHKKADKEDNFVTKKSDEKETQSDETELIMYALPHHMDQMETLAMDGKQFCMSALLAPVCVTSGSSWVIKEDLPEVSFRAPRIPKPQAFSALADALSKDISYELPDYYRRGAGDTYFSGKMLAKLGRIILIAEELKELCGNTRRMRTGGMPPDLADACDNVTLPSSKELSTAFTSLKDAVEIWINGEAITPFVYDHAWGGVVSCGCEFNGEDCSNRFPNCPAFGNPGLNFGNGFYNDMHYHYGYHIYAAAIVARFDPAWGRKHFEQVLLLVRNIANPSPDDSYFTTFRHKDWYQGHSWANGVVGPVPNGRNQESSSEAISAYEAVALFGTVMASAWEERGAKDKARSALEVREVGRLLAATELRAADRYWHVRQKDESLRVLPTAYTENVVGVMWSTMAQFQTWFGRAPYLPYGIQLLPLTPISEARDKLDWAKEMYPPFADGCHADYACTEYGWSILQIAMLATVGHDDLALKQALELDPEVFLSAGGNGHSLTNTIWYIATRPEVSDPLELSESDEVIPKPPSLPEKPKFEVIDCYRPDTCTDEVLDSLADKFTCRERISWLVEEMGHSQLRACVQVAAIEFPKDCGACNPKAGLSEDNVAAETNDCPPCTLEECESKNRCPAYETTFVCTKGSGRGGCAGRPWDIKGPQCSECCELTGCPEALPPVPVDFEPTEDCPPCPQDVCQKSLCPQYTAPFFCVKGTNSGGCSPDPWPLGGGICQKCCTVQPGCN